MKLKDLRYTGEFTTNVTCGLVKGLGDERVVGCGKTGKLEAFHYTLQPGLYSSVSLCPACAAKQMNHKRVRDANGSYALLVGGKEYGAAWKDEGGWAARVTVKLGEAHTVWGETLGEVEVDALAWYRFFKKAVS